eukprot:SM000026S08920  [mRNA]  locus=s26:477363:481548:- [translate_table: standard]
MSTSHLHRSAATAGWGADRQHWWSRPELNHAATTQEGCVILAIDIHLTFATKRLDWLLQLALRSRARRQTQIKTMIPTYGETATQNYTEEQGPLYELEAEPQLRSAFHSARTSTHDWRIQMPSQLQS